MNIKAITPVPFDTKPTFSWPANVRYTKDKKTCTYAEYVCRIAGSNVVISSVIWKTEDGDETSYSVGMPRGVEMFGGRQADDKDIEALNAWKAAVLSSFEDWAESTAHTPGAERKNMPPRLVKKIKVGSKAIQPTAK